MDEVAAKKESVPQTSSTSDSSPMASPFAPKKKPVYKAMCDFDIKGIGSGSCTKVFGSEYAHVLSKWGLVPRGHFLDLSLAQAGIMLYGVKFCYPFLAHLVPYAESLFMTACSASCGFSVYLIYILKYELHDFCVVCMTFHFVNFIMFYLAYKEFSERNKSAAGSESPGSESPNTKALKLA